MILSYQQIWTSMMAQHIRYIHCMYPKSGIASSCSMTLLYWWWTNLSSSMTLSNPLKWWIMMIILNWEVNLNFSAQRELLRNRGILFSCPKMQNCWMGSNRGSNVSDKPPRSRSTSHWPRQMQIQLREKQLHWHGHRLEFLRWKERNRLMFCNTKRIQLKKPWEYTSFIF